LKTAFESRGRKEIPLHMHVHTFGDVKCLCVSTLRCFVYINTLCVFFATHPFFVYKCRLMHHLGAKIKARHSIDSAEQSAVMRYPTLCYNHPPPSSAGCERGGGACCSAIPTCSQPTRWVRRLSAAVISSPIASSFNMHMHTNIVCSDALVARTLKATSPCICQSTKAQYPLVRCSCAGSFMRGPSLQPAVRAHGKVCVQPVYEQSGINAVPCLYTHPMQIVPVGTLG